MTGRSSISPMKAGRIGEGDYCYLSIHIQQIACISLWRFRLFSVSLENILPPRINPEVLAVRYRPPEFASCTFHVPFILVGVSPRLERHATAVWALVITADDFTKEESVLPTQDRSHIQFPIHRESPLYPRGDDILNRYG